MSNQDKELYEFDKFRLDVSERVLLRSGERIPLAEKAFETLCVLIRRGNSLVSKDDLMNEVWPDAIVEENNLDKNISILRQALGERAGKGKFIETVRGHGYRFVSEVHNVEEAALSREPLPVNDLPPEPSIADSKFEDQSQSELQIASPSEISNLRSEIKQTISKQAEPKTKTSNTVRNLLIAGLGGMIVLSLAAVYYWQSSYFSSGAKSIAVLPFRALAEDSRNESLELGMADTLISKLSGGEEIRVRPFSSMRRFASSEQDALSVGSELNVEFVLDGSIQNSGERIRVSARLLRVSDGQQMWTGQFDEDFTDIFAVQDTISERVAIALKVRLSGSGKKHHTENVEAYQLYMKGRFHLLKGIKPGTETAISYFQQAIEADPNYALAYSGLSDAYRGRSLGGEMPSAEFFPKAKAAANRSIELDDTLAEGHANLGHVMFWYDWDWKGAEKQFKRALELDPHSPDSLQFYAHVLSNTGQHAEALEKIKLARELDPLNLRINALEGLFLLHAGRTAEAIERLEKTLDLDPDHMITNRFAARAYSEKGMFAEAVAASAKAQQQSDFGSEPGAFGAYALAKLGKIKEARAALEEMLEASKTRYVPASNIALAYTGLGETEKALEYLERGFVEKDVRMAFLKVEPKWNDLRNEPRFIDLMRRMNFE